MYWHGTFSACFERSGSSRRVVSVKALLQNTRKYRIIFSFRVLFSRCSEWSIIANDDVSVEKRKKEIWHRNKKQQTCIYNEKREHREKLHLYKRLLLIRMRRTRIYLCVVSLSFKNTFISHFSIHYTLGRDDFYQTENEKTKKLDNCLIYSDCFSAIEEIELLLGLHDVFFARASLSLSSSKWNSCPLPSTAKGEREREHCFL